MIKTRRKAEFGDFQTPPELARQVCEVLHRQRMSPRTLIEPTCGVGHFLFAALEQFPLLKNAIAIDINATYTNSVLKKSAIRGDSDKLEVICRSFFVIDWKLLLQNSPSPFLFLGNPPWVTNADLGSLGSKNLPEKTNFQNHTGLDALTGKSNFDISEWMLIRILEHLDTQSGSMAMLCKKATARKVLTHAWKHNLQISKAMMFSIDAKRHFDAAVEACLLVCEMAPTEPCRMAEVYDSLLNDKPSHQLGYRDGKLIADVERFERWKHLVGKSPLRWRSGVKHDCSRVMELIKEHNHYRNGFGEVIQLEKHYLYPMLKSSQLASGKAESTQRWMLVPQQLVGQDTNEIERIAPKTWRYLQSHAEKLDNRRSSIYRKRPRFSIFGIGKYSFAPWKIAISGFYKKPYFRVIGSQDGKPKMLDDTSYFLAFEQREEADFVASLLNSEPVMQLLSALMFQDAKRPITVELLDRLDLQKIARELDSEETFMALFSKMTSSPERQKKLFAQT